MRHRKSGRKLNRTASHRKALFNNLAIAMVKYEMIQTTDAKAKELRSLADHLITLAKSDTVHGRREAFKVLKDRDLVGKLFDDLGKREELATRSGGYTRIVKLGNRPGDNAPISRMSWVGATVESTAAARYPEHLLADDAEA